MENQVTKSNSQNVPTIRFPGFSEAWSKRTFFENIREILDFRGRTPKKLGLSWGGHIPSLSALNVKMGYVDPSVDPHLGSEELYKKWMNKGDLSQNDILFTMEAPLGNVALVPDNKKYILSQRVVAFKTKSLVDNHFLYHLMTGNNFQSIVRDLATGTTAKGVNQKSLKKVSINLPAIDEQQKIAAFLNSVDSWIDNLRSQKSTFESYKKSIMKKLFSQEIRFKDENGQYYPEWDKTKLSSLVTITTGKKDVNAGNPNGEYRFYTCAKQYTFSDSYSFEGKAILIAGNAEVGLCQYFDGKFEAYQRTYVLQNFKINAEYLFRYLSQYFRSYALGLKQTGAMSFIKLGMLHDFQVPLPSISEQQKIADFLTSIDKSIESKEKEIVNAERWKNGLMQQMFI